MNVGDKIEMRWELLEPDTLYTSGIINPGTVLFTANGIFVQLMDYLDLWEFYDEDLNELDIGGLSDEMFPLEIVRESGDLEFTYQYKEFRERSIIEWLAVKNGGHGALVDGAL